MRSPIGEKTVPPQIQEVAHSKPGAPIAASRKLRVNVVVPWGERLGGAEEMLDTLVRGQAAAGYELQLTHLIDGSWAAELRAHGVRTTTLRAGRLRQAHRWLVAVRQLAAGFRERRPDLILSWSPKAHLYAAPAAALAGMTGRLVWWQHGIPTGGWLDRCATALPAQSIGCSCRAGAAAQARLSPARRTFVVHPGVRPVAVSPAVQPLDLPHDRIVVGIVGRLQPWKGQDRWLRAHASLRDRGHRLHTLVVGGDAYGLSAGYAASLPTLVRSLDLDSEVTLWGQVADARAFMAHMDIVVNASDPEPFGIVLLEAMAAGVPVVAVNQGGPSEFIDDGLTGILAPSGSPTDLASAVERLVNSPELRLSIGASGRAAVATDFTDEVMCGRFADELRRVMAAVR